MKKPWHYIAAFSGVIVLGIVIGYLLFNCSIPENKNIEQSEKELKKTVEFLEKENDSLYKVLQEVRKIDSTLEKNEKQIDKNHRRMRVRGINDAAYDSLLQSILARGSKRFD